MGHKGFPKKRSWRLALRAELLRKGRGLEVWGFQVEEFLRKEAITKRVSEGGVKIWTQNKEGFIHQHKDSKKSCTIFQG